MLWIHIAGGLVALLAGYVTLAVRKGGGGHKASGRAFGYAMFVMTISGAIMAALLRPNPGNVLAATTTFYLVATGWLTVLPGADAMRRRRVALCVLGFAAATYGAIVAAIAFDAPRMVLHGIPAPVLAMFSLVALLSATGDLRLLRGRVLDGSRRLLRHLWRMGFALWIATLSFFLGQADEFPKAVRDTGVLVVPVLAVGATILYWVARQLRAGRRAKRRRLDPQPT